MRRHSLWACLFLLVAIACGDDDTPSSDGGITPERDGGGRDGGEVERDGGEVERDGGEAPDGGSDAGTETPRPVFVYLGLTSGDLVVHALEGDTLVERSRTRTGNFPSFLAPSADGRFLYVVHEGASEVAALAVTPGTGEVSVIDRESTGGGPTHVETDGRFVFTANYGGGNVSVFPLAADGTLSPASATLASGSQTHQVVVDRDRDHLYVPSKGEDLVAQYALGAGGPTPLDPATVDTRRSSGPRHLALDPSQTHAYVIHENDRTVTVHDVNGDGTLGDSRQRIDTLPGGAPASGSTAEILVHPNGRFVYGSNRGHDSVVVFRIEGDATLALVEHESTRGDHPRSMTLTPDGTRLIVANLNSNDVQVFAVDEATGALEHRTTLAASGGPFFVGAFAIAAE
ncbi:MAG: lactonase family protein [Polyangiales bacterium]